MRHLKYSVFLLIWLAGEASVASVHDWEIVPTQGYDAVSVILPEGTAAGAATIESLSTNYFAGRSEGVNLSTTIGFRDRTHPALQHCTLDTALNHVMNALISDDFSAVTAVFCGKQTIPVELHVNFQYPVAGTLFVELEMQPTKAGSPVSAITSKTTLKHQGDRSPNAPTMTVIDLNRAAKNEFPVTQQKAYPPVNTLRPLGN